MNIIKAYLAFLLDIRQKGLNLIKAQRSALGYTYIVGYYIMALLFPIYVISGVVIGTIIFIHAGWIALLAYIACKISGICPL